MALGRAHSVAVAGVDGQLVEIEADIGQGLPSVHLVGLPDTALTESRDRVRAAVANSGEKWPDGRVILALSPATLPKVGSVYDLALAAAVLDAADAIPSARLGKAVLLGELALDGRVRRVRGILPAVMTARAAGWPTVVVPRAALAEAGLVQGIEVLGAETLRGLVAWLRGEGGLAEPDGVLPGAAAPDGDLSEVVGQEEARWALEVAAAGGHHLLLTGPPGIGKTMLAQRLPSLLPPLTEAESLEVTAIHSMAGALSGEHPLVTTPPFVAPHHSTSVTAMIGGGTARHGRARSAGRTAGCCSSTNAPRSAPRCSRRCVPRSRRARCASPAATASPAIPRASSWYSPPTRARARPPATWTASARRWPVAATWANCPVR